MNNLLLIYKNCKILINIEKNQGKLIDSLYNSEDDIIIKLKYISNLDVFGLENGCHCIYFLNQVYEVKKKYERDDPYRCISTWDINEKFFIIYDFCVFIPIFQM